jgi:hypothetical protein
LAHGLPLQRTFGGKDGAVALIVEWALEQILPSETLPKRTTIIEAIEGGN